LEYMAATPAAKGTVYDTSDKALHGHTLCEDDCCQKSGEQSCHDPATLFAAVPEYSTPAPASAANAAIEPAVFNLLKKDFSSRCLPYSQALDVARVYLRYFCTTRYETMRTFRRCITEFVLDPEHEPTGFQPHLWRFPVRIDTAIEYLCITPEEYPTVFHG